MWSEVKITFLMIITISKFSENVTYILKCALDPNNFHVLDIHHLFMLGTWFMEKSYSTDLIWFLKTVYICSASLPHPLAETPETPTQLTPEPISFEPLEETDQGSEEEVSHCRSH